MFKSCNQENKWVYHAGTYAYSLTQTCQCTYMHHSLVNCAMHSPQSRRIWCCLFISDTQSHSSQTLTPSDAYVSSINCYCIPLSAECTNLYRRLTKVTYGEQSGRPQSAGGKLCGYQSYCGKCRTRLMAIHTAICRSVRAIFRCEKSIMVGSVWHHLQVLYILEDDDAYVHWWHLLTLSDLSSKPRTHTLYHVSNLVAPCCPIFTHCQFSV